MNNVRDFGAKGDGKTNDTLAIQRAIDAGGTVLVPKGEYITGTLYLKSHGGLYLEAGAVLRASHNREDYNSEDFCPQNCIFEEEFMAGTHLITAVEQEDIFVSGYGTIDGDSHFWVNEKRVESYCSFFAHPPKEAQRPGQMLFFAECKNVRVENINLRYSPFWHLFFLGCENVIARGLNIKGETRQWVNDGIDIDCCKNVCVSDCIIETGDDGITLRASGKKLQKREEVCENITVTNCIITSYLDYGVRIGVGGGIIRNALFSNIIIRNSLNGLGITCRFSPQGESTSVENIRFSGVSVQALCAFEMKISNLQKFPPLKEPAYVRNLSISDFYAESNRFCYLQGFENADFSNIRFINGEIRFSPETGDRIPCVYSDTDNKCAAFYFNKLNGITLKNIKIDKGQFEKATVFDECENLILQ